MVFIAGWNWDGILAPAFIIGIATKEYVETTKAVGANPRDAFFCWGADSADGNGIVGGSTIGVIIPA